jgi:hypothetical protein
MDAYISWGGNASLSIDGKDDKEKNRGPVPGTYSVHATAPRRGCIYEWLSVIGCDATSNIYTRVHICLSLCGVGVFGVCRPLDELYSS